MPPKPLTPDSDFLVKDDKVLNFLVAGLCFLFFAISVIGFTGNYLDYFSIPFFLGPAILFFVKGMKNRIIIAVNKKGIFYQGKMVTNWTNFYNAHIKEEEKLGRISDNFILIVKCYSEAKGDYADRKIKLTNTQSQSEEAIIEAIKYFNRVAKNSGT